MFDQPPSLPMRAAIASLLGSCFGIAMILATHSAQAQEAQGAADAGSAAAADPRGVIRRIGDAAVASLRGPDPALAYGNAGGRGLRIPDGGADGGIGLRLQALPSRTLRGDVDGARNSSSPLTLGVQVRF